MKINYLHNINIILSYIYKRFLVPNVDILHYNLCIQVLLHFTFDKHTYIIIE